MQRKKILLLSVISGLLLSLPWLVSGLSWTLFFAFCPLLFAEDRITKQKDERISQLFLPAFLTFLIWNLLSTWWIAYVSLAGMLLITTFNSILMASVWWSKHLVVRKFGRTSSLFSLIVFWIAFEFLHHNWTLPWPWLSLGNGFANSIEIIQWYEFTGVLGGSLWVLLANLLIYSAVRNYRNRGPLPETLKQGGFAILTVLLPIIGSLYLYATYTEKGDLREVAILQPNIDPYTEKFSGNSEDQIRKILFLTESRITDSTDLVVAPETSWPDLWEDSLFTQEYSLLPLKEYIQRYPKVSFIVGAITQRKFGLSEAISETAQKSADRDLYFDVYNSALMIGRNPEVQICHKSILVNGVERMPFQKYFSFLDEYLLDLGGTNRSMAAADEPVLLSGKGSLKVGQVICFESVFGEYCSQLVRRGANLLVVITNDGWWRQSPGSWQHFGYSRLRAVEARRTIVQSANTGISGFINQSGEVIRKTELNTYEAIRSSVRINNANTFYVNQGDLIGRICLIVSGLIVFYLLMYGRLREAKKNPH
jgi:apolipoprotein N-acyltransferase